MKTAVILHLCILISYVFVVKCEDDDEGENGDDAVLSNMKCLGKNGMILLTLGIICNDYTYSVQSSHS